MPFSANGAQAALRASVVAAVGPHDRIVLAVSGGRDSMVLLDAMARWRFGAIVAVATFDHGTGAASAGAVALVRSAAHAIGVPLVTARAGGLRRSEASWRTARWAFLRDSAAELAARVATAHTEDDHVETVFMRALRDSGPRGLAGLYAESDVVRPLLRVPAQTVVQYAEARELPFADDPSNRSRRFLRNRVRLDILPALEAANPGFRGALLALSRRAAAWRSCVERRVDAMGVYRTGASVFVPANELSGYDEAALAILWPAIAARAGIALDRRGTERLAGFATAKAASAARRVTRACLAGRHEVVRHSSVYELRPAGGLP